MASNIITEQPKECPRCGSYDVRLCNISVRPYCGECKHWGSLNLNGTMEDAIKEWNRRA